TILRECAIKRQLADRLNKALDNVLNGHSLPEIAKVTEALLNGARGAATPRGLVLRFSSLAKLLDLQGHDVEFIVPGLIARHAVTVVSADPGAGKSTLATYLAVKIAAGEEAFGKLCQQCPVVYLDRENSLSVTKERVQRLHLDQPPDLHIWGGWIG